MSAGHGPNMMEQLSEVLSGEQGTGQGEDAEQINMLLEQAKAYEHQ